MIFGTASKNERPVRLSESTRQFAYESLHGKYGDEAVSHGAVTLDDVEDFDMLDDYGKYDIAVRRIAEQAPLRITESERVCGAATLGLAIRHVVPATRNGNAVYGSMSHLTCGFDRAVNEGIDEYEKRIDLRLSDTENLDQRQIRFLQSLRNTVASMRIWHKRYLDATKDSRPDLYENLKVVPFSKPRNFHQAVQSLWFCFAFTRLCGNWPGLGRIDEYLGEYLKRDLRDGKITTDEAREILASMFIKGCEWIESDTAPGSGDAQHYQNIVLGGLGPDGIDITNEVTYLVLDIVEELPIGDFPITVRLSKNSPEKLYRRVCEVQRHGGGVVAVYNEELILKAMTDAGYRYSEALRFANDGCWEVQVPGKTYFTYIPFDSLSILQRRVLKKDGKDIEYESFDSLYACFKDELGKTVFDLCSGVQNAWVKDGKWLPKFPMSVVALFEDGCIENARDYGEGGPVYNVVSPHIGGAPDVGNSLYVIDKLCFKEKRLTLKELYQALSDNWQGYEALRQYVTNKLTYYGNDCDESDSYTVRVIDDFAEITHSYHSDEINFVPGVSTFGRQIEWAPVREAVPFGFKKGDILSGNLSPTPGTDAAGATAIIKSYCKSNLVRQTTGAALDIKLFPSSVEGENGLEAMIALIKGFIALGGFFMQTDVVDAETLRAAQENPKEYKTLSVRVSGWNARFVTLNKEWQQMIIERTEQGI